MKQLGLIVCTLAAATFVSFPAQSAGMTEDQVAVKLAESMEKFYGKDVKEVGRFLKKEYGVKKPMKKEGSQVTYMVPMSDPLCGSVALDTSGGKVTGLQTMAWDRNGENVFGEACNKAFGGN